MCMGCAQAVETTAQIFRDANPIATGRAEGRRRSESRGAIARLRREREASRVSIGSTENGSSVWSGRVGAEVEAVIDPVRIGLGAWTAGAAATSSSRVASQE
jgi:hypothetical protein